MPDITLCTNDECPYRKECYRYTAKPNELWQSYSRFWPEAGECVHFMETRGARDGGLDVDLEVVGR